MRVDPSQVLAQGGVRAKRDMDALAGSTEDADVEETAVGSTKGDGAEDLSASKSNQMRSFEDKNLAGFAAKLAQLKMPVTESSARAMRELLAQHQGLSMDEAAFLASNKIDGDKSMIKAALDVLSGAGKTHEMIEQIISTLDKGVGKTPGSPPHMPQNKAVGVPAHIHPSPENANVSAADKAPLSAFIAAVVKNASRLLDASVSLQSEAVDAQEDATQAEPMPDEEGAQGETSGKPAVSDAPPGKPAVPEEILGKTAPSEPTPEKETPPVKPAPAEPAPDKTTSVEPLPDKEAMPKQAPPVEPTAVTTITPDVPIAAVTEIPVNAVPIIEVTPVDILPHDEAIPVVSITPPETAAALTSIPVKTVPGVAPPAPEASPFIPVTTAETAPTAVPRPNEAAPTAAPAPNEAAPTISPTNGETISPGIPTHPGAVQVDAAPPAPMVRTVAKLISEIPQFQGTPQAALDRFSSMLLRIAEDMGKTEGNRAKTPEANNIAKDAAALTSQLEKMFVRIGRKNDNAGLRMREVKEELFARLMLAQEEMERAPLSLKQQIHLQTQKLMDHVKVLNSIEQFAYMQIPVQLSEEQRTAELYIFKRKGKKKSDPDNVNILLSIDLEFMGHWEALLNIKGKNVRLNMEVAGEAKKEHFIVNTVLLYEMLSEVGFKLIDTTINISQEKTTPLNALSAFDRYVSGNQGKIDYVV